MITVNNNPQPTLKQRDAINDFLNDLDNCEWDGIYGFYSNGDCVINLKKNNRTYHAVFCQEGLLKKINK